MSKATTAGVHLKFQRAQEHAAELERHVREFLDSRPFEVYQEEDASTSDLLFRARVHRQPPAEFSQVIGDVVHNARTALDHLAWQLVLANGAQPKDQTYFPITKDAASFHSRAKSSLKGVSRQAFALVEQLQPYHGGDERFWRLHRLDIEDKHHLLIPVGAAHRNVVVSTSFLGNEDIPPFTVPPYGIRPADRQYPLTDGAVVLRVARAALEAQSQSQWRSEYGVTVEVAFGDGTIVAGEPLIPTLATLVEEIRQQVQPLIDYLEAS